MTESKFRIRFYIDYVRESVYLELNDGEHCGQKVFFLKRTPENMKNGFHIIMNKSVESIHILPVCWWKATLCDGLKNSFSLPVIEN